MTSCFPPQPVDEGNARGGRKRGKKQRTKERREEGGLEMEGSGEVRKSEFITGEKYSSEFIARIFRQKMLPLSLKKCREYLRNT